MIRENLIKIPRTWRVYFGKVFICMLGKNGTDEFENDINLYNELNIWIEAKGKPNVKL